MASGADRGNLAETTEEPRPPMPSSWFIRNLSTDRRAGSPSDSKQNLMPRSRHRNERSRSRNQLSPCRKHQSRSSAIRDTRFMSIDDARRIRPAHSVGYDGRRGPDENVLRVHGIDEHGSADTNESGRDKWHTRRSLDHVKRDTGCKIDDMHAVMPSFQDGQIGVDTRHDAQTVSGSVHCGSILCPRLL
jgi:hypothetical protein